VYVASAPHAVERTEGFVWEYFVVRFGMCVASCCGSLEEIVIRRCIRRTYSRESVSHALF